MTEDVTEDVAAVPLAAVVVVGCVGKHSGVANIVGIDLVFV